MVKALECVRRRIASKRDGELRIRKDVPTQTGYPLDDLGMDRCCQPSEQRRGDGEGFHLDCVPFGQWIRAAVGCEGWIVLADGKRC